MMTEAEIMFVSETIRTARSLSLTESLTFLDGCIACLNKQHPATLSLSKVRHAFVYSDSQLELILREAGK